MRLSGQVAGSLAPDALNATTEPHVAHGRICDGTNLHLDLDKDVPPITIQGASAYFELRIPPWMVIASSGCADEGLPGLDIVGSR